MRGRRLCRADRRNRAVRQQLQPTDRLHAHPAPMDLRIADQGTQLHLQRAQDAGDLLRPARQVVGRAHPQGDCRNRQLATPVQQLVQLPRTLRIDQQRIDHARQAPEATIAVENDADMARRRTLPHLSEQPAPIQRIDRPREAVQQDVPPAPPARQPRPPSARRTLARSLSIAAFRSDVAAVQARMPVAMPRRASSSSYARSSSAQRAWNAPAPSTSRSSLPRLHAVHHIVDRAQQRHRRHIVIAVAVAA